MSKAYIFLKKIVVLGLSFLAFLLAMELSLPLMASLSILVTAFGLVVSKIINDSPKELFNFKRSEQYFSKGGLRDLLRIPVVFFAFVHDVAVWGIWGVYQVFVLLVDVLTYLKELLVWCLQLLIWVIQQLMPFWRILFKMFFFYLIKWPWWIYRYAYYSIKRTFNWNILRISLIGTFFSLLTFQVFYFLDITFEIPGMRYVGIVLGFLPLSWLFGEISALRAQNLLAAPYKSVKKKFRNGLETVRAMLFFITFFVVTVLVQCGLYLSGWIPKTGMIFLGLTFNLGFLLNLFLLLLTIIIVFGSFIIPSHRLYNEFSETSVKDVFKLLKQLLKRGLQYIFGFIPASFFATISALPALLVVTLALLMTLWIKNSVVEAKINRLETTNVQHERYKNQKEINYLQYVKLFPKQFFQEMGHRILLEDELNAYVSKKEGLQLALTRFNAEMNAKISSIDKQVSNESKKPVINQTRIEELQALRNLHKKRLSTKKTATNLKIAETEIDIEYAKRKLKHLPVIFFLSGFCLVFMGTFILAFFFAYFGNFFYKTYLFRNDGTDAEWKQFIHDEKKTDKNQPLLSTTINLFLISFIIFVLSQIGHHQHHSWDYIWPLF